MLTIVIEAEELYDEQTQTFGNLDEVVLELEHSLVSLSKWESIFQKPFLGPDEKTEDEVIGYIEAMVTSGNFSMEIYKRLTMENLDKINDYIGSEQSATTFVDTSITKGRGKSEIVTSELIYYWMVAYTVPFSCETWHLNRLFALLRICNIKNSTQKKMSKSEVASRNRELNAQRKAQLGTTG